MGCSGVVTRGIEVVRVEVLGVEVLGDEGRAAVKRTAAVFKDFLD